MKKYLYIAAALFAALSCTKETPSNVEENPATPESRKVQVTRAVSQAETKTYVDSDQSTLLWESGDALGVFTDLDTTTPIEFTMSGEPGSSASFTGTVTEGASTFYVFYPYDSEATFSEGKITTTLPTTQTIGSNNTAKGAMLTMGKTTTNSVTLTPVFGYLKFKIQNEDVKTIVIGSGSVNFAGQAQFTAETGAKVSGGSTNSITVTKGEGYFAKDTYYYVPVIPVTVPAGEFTFAIDSNTHGDGTGSDGHDDWKAERTATGAMEFTQGRAKKFDALDADGSTNKWTWYFDIHDAASLERFRALVAAGKFPSTANGGIAKFTSDINLSGKTLAAAAGTFSGTLDGQGHSITNWASSGRSLFNLVTGTVKNLTVATNCTLSFPTPLTG